jgi:hypothetical protein
MSLAVGKQEFGDCEIIEIISFINFQENQIVITMILPSSCIIFITYANEIKLFYSDAIPIVFLVFPLALSQLLPCWERY